VLGSVPMMKLGTGPLGEVCLWAACVPLGTVTVLEILGKMGHGWPFYTAMSVFLLVAVPISALRRRAKREASERALVGS
jgi:hypothetical protein